MAFSLDPLYRLSALLVSLVSGRTTFALAVVALLTVLLFLLRSRRT